MRIRARVLIALAIAGSLLVPGCSTYHDPATGARATYACETLKARLDVPIGTVYAAARRATAELRLRSMRAAEDGISGEIAALDAHRDSVCVDLGALPENRTLLTIRVGVFGDKNKSIVLFERILANLSQEERAAAITTVQWGSQSIELQRTR